MTKTDYTLNTAYNLFLTQVVLWHGLKNRIDQETSLGYRVVKNLEKMNRHFERAYSIALELDLTDVSIYESYYPMLDDRELIALFIDEACINKPLIEIEGPCPF